MTTQWKRPVRSARCRHMPSKQGELATSSLVFMPDTVMYHITQALYKEIHHAAVSG